MDMDSELDFVFSLAILSSVNQANLVPVILHNP